jgi:ribosomal protein S18 acetylase RimI-like enzyme
VVGDVLARLEPPIEDAPRQLLRDLGRVRLRVDALGVEEAYRRQGLGHACCGRWRSGGGPRARSGRC